MHALDGILGEGYACAVLLGCAGLLVDSHVAEGTRYQAVGDGEADNAGPNNSSFWGCRDKTRTACADRGLV